MRVKPVRFVCYGRHSDIRARSLGGKSLESIQRISDVGGLKLIFESCLTAVGGDPVVWEGVDYVQRPLNGNGGYVALFRRRSG